MAHTKHLIIGAGVAGMYIAMQLYQKGESFVILDMTDKPHTKLESIKEDKTNPNSVILEMGASVFHTDQPKLLSLIKFFNLSDKVKVLPSSKRAFVYDNFPSFLTHDFYEILYKKLERASKKNKLLTIDELATQILSNQEYNLFTNAWDCWYEVCDMNAYVYFSTKEGQYLYLEGGLKQITRKGWEMFHIVNDPVSSVNYFAIKRKYIVECKHTTYFADHIYVCIGLEHLPKINWNRFTTAINKIENLAEIKSSMRYYIILKDKLNIEVDQLIGDIIGRWWIKITPKIFMLYCDGPAADYLERFSDTSITKEWLHEVNSIFKLKLTDKDIKRTIRGYWKTAFEVLTPSYYTNGVPKTPFLITSLPHPKDQAWMEGHLYELSS